MHPAQSRESPLARSNQEDISRVPKMNIQIQQAVLDVLPAVNLDYLAGDMASLV